MESSEKPSEVDLLRLAKEGDKSAREQLLERQRDRLRRLAEFRLDHRIAARVDASDVVQETLVEASRRLPDYLESQPIPFYPWVRQIAAERIVKLHRTHLAAQKRTVAREARPGADQTSLHLAKFLLASGTSPSTRMANAERSQQVQAAMAQLSDDDREIITLRHLEQLSIIEIAAVMKVSQTAAKSKHFRALRKLQALLDLDLSP